jgi:hypothetical protein
MYGTGSSHNGEYRKISSDDIESFGHPHFIVGVIVRPVVVPYYYPACLNAFQREP